MKTYYDCIPCLIGQALGAVRLATRDEGIHETVLRKVLLEAGGMDLKKSPPEMAHFIHRLIQKLSGNPDPYRAHKQHYNQNALERYGKLNRMIRDDDRGLETALRLAIAGNVIDFGTPHTGNAPDLDGTIARALSEEPVGNVDQFLEAVFAAQRILYLGDNAGEIVFDRLFIAQLPLDKITYVVKGGPIINDATMADAVETGMTDLVRVIDNGFDAPGTLLNFCSTTFQKEFFAADLIIAKGQANYETLSAVQKPIGFLLKTKCPVIARDIGCEIGRFVVQCSGFPTVKEDA